MNDEIAVRSLEPVIQALKASISMQKAISNNFTALEKLRVYGYSNGFISTSISNGSGKTISTGLFASMMYRARMKASGFQTKSYGTRQDISVTPSLENVTLSERKLGSPTNFRKLRNEPEDWEALAESAPKSDPPHPFAHIAERANKERSLRRNNDQEFHNSVPDLKAIYDDDKN